MMYIKLSWSLEGNYDENLDTHPQLSLLFLESFQIGVFKEKGGERN